MTKLLDGKATVITGAGRGIGRACAEVFVREGVVPVDGGWSARLA
jgi:NAD(P)-dependent dehydrogenase (short-subunit alcohol dehydrogenase family)